MTKFQNFPIPYVLAALFMWGAFFIYDFKVVQDNYDHQTKINFNIIESRIVANNIRYQEILNLLRAEFENYSTNSKYQNIIIENLKYNQELGLFDSNNFNKYGFGSITYRKKEITKDKVLEMERALSLSYLFQEVKKIMPNSPWVYYTSSDFIYIYPFVNSREYSFKEDTPTMQFYKMSLPENNQERAIFWTDPYIDEAGEGLMSTVSLPVYIGDAFSGSLSIDFKLTDLQNYLRNIVFDSGEYQIINQSGYLLTSTNSKSINPKVLKPLYHNDVIKSSLKKFNTLFQGSDILHIYHTELPSFKLVYKTNFFDYYLKIFSLMYLSLFFGLFLLMVIVGLVLYNNFQKKLYADDVQKNKLISLAEMSAGIAHEINNPLTVIRGRTEQLMRSLDKDTDLDKTYFLTSLERIVNSSDRIAKIVKALKNFSREGKSDPFVQINLKSIIDDAIILCENRIRNNDAELSIGEVPDVFLNCRPYQIVQILINVINNSYDAIENLSDKSIALIFSINGTNVYIRIIDSGNGINKDIVTKMFDPFFTSKDINKGTGLGLSISKRIAIDHGGDLYYELYNEKTSFVIELPIDKFQ